MSNIKINHKHGRDKDTACTIADSMIDDLAQDYNLNIESNDTGFIKFSGSGISGTVEIDDYTVQISVQLGFLMSTMKPVIKNAIESKLQEKFS